MISCGFSAGDDFAEGFVFVGLKFFNLACVEQDFFSEIGVVAQLGEHLPCTQGVRSSILLGSTNYCLLLMYQM